MRDDPFDIHVAESAGWENSSREFQNFGKILFPAKLIDRGTADHTGNGDFRSKGGNENSVAGLQPLHAGTDPMQEEIVHVDVLDQLFATVVFQQAQGTA